MPAVVFEASLACTYAESMRAVIAAESVLLVFKKFIAKVIGRQKLGDIKRGENYESNFRYRS